MLDVELEHKARVTFVKTVEYTSQYKVVLAQRPNPRLGNGTESITRPPEGGNSSDGRM